MCCVMVLSEKYLGTARKIIRQVRAHLLPKNFEKLLFLKVYINIKFS